ncbi:bifunctional oligoribonuclease/PAP phosphatase NrnA [Deinococcus sp. KNUC1210]|uniref:DHH family phosphoesterase n=1 Tax=Deinococcus sp. KNUC1210 TaxID=2917691 RepID=UPI001EEFB3E7|nr:bifunctional oligoribonuclease/PAP phosphatase NrnA [Deinococcus sp. KNUC1210]ULH15628.1 bifunctional oligoribonuclease/PAP phosphatase NrnA [Deinococcus sp. KNUC1210]
MTAPTPPQNIPNPDYAAQIQAVADHLDAHTGPVVIVAHVDPDGDALGSCLGLQRTLRACGKEAQTYMEVPHYLAFLPQPGEVLPRLESWPEGALLVVLDVDNNDAARVAGADLSSFTGSVINVDHHGTNKRQASLGVVDPSQAATAGMVADIAQVLLERSDQPWTPEIATPLLTGLNTDTGSFRFANTTPAVLRQAASLVEHGARLAWINDRLSQNPPRYYALLKEVLGSMAFSHGGLVVTARIDAEMLSRAGAEWEDVESYVNTIRSAEGTELACLFKDYGSRVKVSLRSRGRVSAQNIAVALGGGGHVPAAGASVDGDYAAVQAAFDAAVTTELKRAGLTD